MFVSRLGLTDFRSWQSAQLDLLPGASVLVGPNGHGKTNLVEALGYLSTLSSHRVAADAPLIRSGAQHARIGATAINDGRELSVDLIISEGKANRAQINRSPVRRTRDILGVVRTVLFAPEDLALVRGDPTDRRRFLDELLSLRIPRMAGVRADYDRVLRQRSALLKTAGGNLRRGRARADGGGALATLEVWDGHLAAHGAQLLAGRLDLVSALSPHLRAAYTSIAPESRAAAIEYRSSVGAELADAGVPADAEFVEAAMLSRLAQVRDREIDRGVCLVGPHRDDLLLELGTEPAKGYASHGECWSFALALRLASFSLLRSEGTDPVLILDDVFAELDRRRSSALAAVAADAEQVIITAAVAEDVPGELDARRFVIHAAETDQGRISTLELDSPSHEKIATPGTGRGTFSDTGTE